MSQRWMMVHKKESILVILSDNRLLSFRNGRSEFSQYDEKILSNFSKIIKQDKNFKYLVPLTENNCIMLRSLITEILYVSVEPDGGNIFFITDKAGESFLHNMLYDFHTESTDLNINLLKHQKAKIHIITTGQIPTLSENDIAIFFRRTDKSSDLINAKRAICIVTLRDFYKHVNRHTDLVKIFESRGWSQLQTTAVDQSPPSKNDSSCIEINIEETQHKGISDFYQSAIEAGFCNGTLKEYIQNFAFFYMAVSIPLKWYDYYKSENPDNEEFIATMLPSESASRIPNIGVQQSIILNALCSNLEKELQDENPKYKKITSAVKTIAKDDGTAAILMPNKIVSDAFAWSLFEAKMARGIHHDDVAMYYPESFFIESLFEEKKYDLVIIPFVPSYEIILAAQNITKKLHFILYPFERKILHSILYEANKPQSMQWYTPYSSKKFAIIDNNNGNLTAVKKFTSNLGDSKEYAYNLFLSYLAGGDPKEGDTHDHYEGVVDKRLFIFTSEDGLEHLVHGWESVILFNQEESAFFRKYVWVAPSAIERKDKIFIVPPAVHYAQFERELEENLKENITNLQDLIRYISKWKAALIAIQKNNSYAQIQRKLATAGLVRDYVTIRHWFSDLLEDPKESTISSIINSKSNIGPKYAEDIKKLGQTFGIKDLIEHYELIHYAMKAIRTNNQHMGKTTMNKILANIEKPEMKEQCIFFEVKKIKVKG